ncbi:MAG: hypothetical protein WBJ32_02015 [Bacillota bacterium]
MSVTEKTRFIVQEVVRNPGITVSDNNEVCYKGFRAVIKSAGPGALCDISEQVSEQLDVVVFAVEISPNVFDVFSVPFKKLADECNSDE